MKRNSSSGRSYGEDGITGLTRKPKLQLVNENYSEDKNEENLSLEFSDFKKELQELKELLFPSDTASGLNDWSESNMEQVMEKLNDIDKKVAVLEERTKKLDNLPTKEEIKNIITESISNTDIASKSDVELAVVKSRNTQLVWTVGSILAAVGVIVRFV